MFEEVGSVQIGTRKILTGNSARKLVMCNGKTDALRTNSVLQHEDWVDMQKDHIIPMAQKTLKAYQDLIDLGLTVKLPGIGKTETKWQIEGDMSPANVSMNTMSQGDKDLLDYETDSAPVPVIFKDMEIDWRTINASRIEGTGIDVANADAAARKVAVAMEDMVVNGYAHTLEGKHIWGYTTHPNRGIVTGFDATPLNITTAENMVLAAIRDSEGRDYKGPFNLYIPTGYSTELYRRFGDGSAEVLKDWLNRVDLIEKVTATSALAPGNMVLVQMDRTVVDLAIGLPLEPIEWEVEGGMGFRIRIITAGVPRIKKRVARGGGYQAGITHLRFRGA